MLLFLGVFRFLHKCLFLAAFCQKFQFHLWYIKRIMCSSIAIPFSYLSVYILSENLLLFRTLRIIIALLFKEIRCTQQFTFTIFSLISKLKTTKSAIPIPYCAFVSFYIKSKTENSIRGPDSGNNNTRASMLYDSKTVRVSAREDRAQALVDDMFQAFLFFFAFVCFSKCLLFCFFFRCVCVSGMYGAVEERALRTEVSLHCIEKNKTYKTFV